MDGVVGFITMFAGDFAPKGWAFCEGQALISGQNMALYDVCQNLYNTQSQQGFFNLPDLRCRQPVGAGQGPGLTQRNMGETMGQNYIMLDVDHMPTHTHDLGVTTFIAANSDSGNSSSPVGNSFAVDSENGYAATANATMQTVNGTLQTSYEGGGTELSRINPVMGINFVICLYSTYPSRD